MAFAPQYSKVVRELIDAGIIPAECTKFEIIIKVNHPVLMRSEVFISEDDFRKMADSLKVRNRDNPDESPLTAEYE